MKKPNSQTSPMRRVVEPISRLIVAPARLLVQNIFQRTPVADHVVAMVVTVGISISVILFITIWTQETHAITTEFEGDADARIIRLQNTLEIGLDDLSSIAGFYQASKNVSRSEFRTFVQHELKSEYKTPGLLALEWAPYVTASERTAYETAARAEGLTDFQLTELDHQGNLVPATQRDDYFPVYFVEPREGNEKALGFDLGSEQNRRDTLLRARDSGKTLTTSPLNLIQSDRDQTGVLIVQPVYRTSSVAASVAERRKNLLGFVTGAFQIGDVLEVSLLDVPIQGMDTFLFQGSHLLYAHPSRLRSTPLVVDPNLTPSDLNTALLHTTMVTIAGQEWEIVLCAIPEYLATRRTWTPWIAAGTGLLFTVLVALFFVQRQQANTALRESQKLYRLLAENISDVIWIMDVETRRLRYISPSIQQLRGYTPEQVLAEDMDTTLSPDSLRYVQHVIPERVSEFQQGHTNVYVDTIEQFRQDGTTIWTEIVTRFLVNEDTGRLEVYGTTRNISERKQMEDAIRVNLEKYRVLFEIFPLGVTITDKDGNILETNQEAEYILGVTREEHTSRGLISPDWSIVRPDYTLMPPEEYAAIRALREQRVVRNVEMGILKESGTISWINVTAAPIPLEGYGVAVAYIDITERKQMEVALHESEERYRNLIENSHDLIQRISADGYILFVNHTWLAALGYRDVNLSRMTIWDIIAPNEQVVWKNLLAEAARGKAITSFSTTFRTRSGQPVEVEGSAIPNMREGALVAVNSFFRNVTEQRYGERIQATQFAVSRILAESPELNTALPLVLEALASDLGWQLAGFWYRVENEDTLIWSCDWYNAAYASMGDAASTIRAYQFVPGCEAHIQNWLACQGTWHKDVNEEHDQFPTMIAAAGLHTAAGIPIIASGTCLGVLILFSTTTRPYDKRLLDILLDLGRQIGQFVARKQAETDLKAERGLLTLKVAERTADLSRANMELAKAVRTKDEFLANMSHELRTPLNAILGMSESLQEDVYGSLNERQRRSLALIERSGRHLLSLINDILDLSKIEAGHIDLDREHVSVESVCQTSIQFVRQQAFKKDITLSLTIADRPGAVGHEEEWHSYDTVSSDMTIYADERRLKQILINLLNNAVKFTTERGKIGLDVQTDTHNHVVHFTVWDTGIGIAPEDQERLFQPFIQVDSSLSREYEGTGLGLALVMRLTELHGGSVSLESAVGVGSRFTISLPQYQAATLEVDGQGDTMLACAKLDSKSDLLADASKASSADTSPPLILLAEDNEATLAMVSDFLTIKGYRVVVAHNGQEAIAATSEHHPALILMDIHMPKMNGLEAIQHIRTTMGLIHIPIIAMTALSMSGDRERCLEAGATDYLSKPVRLKDLEVIVEQALATPVPHRETVAHPG